MAESIKPSSTTVDASRSIRPDEAREKPVVPDRPRGNPTSLPPTAPRAFTPSAKDYMTPNPHVIASHEPVTNAGRMMQEHGIRHLLVVDGETVLGVISERDVAMVSATPGATLEKLTVEHATSRDLYTVSVDTALNRAARGMAERKCGSAVVTDHGRVVGILTTVDALEALADALEGKDGRARHEVDVEGPPRGGATRPPDRESRT